MLTLMPRKRMSIRITGETDLPPVQSSDPVFRYLKDFFISMIDMPWHWTIISFGASFYISWLLFAVLWYIIAPENGNMS